jgi:hypothetical protein
MENTLTASLGKTSVTRVSFVKFSAMVRCKLGVTDIPASILEQENKKA